MALVRLDDLPRDEQPEPDAAVVRRHRALELAPDPLHILARDPDALITNLEADQRPVLACRNMNAPTAAVLEGVEQEVRHHLVDAQTIPAPTDRRHVDHHLGSRLIRARPQPVGDVGHELGEIHLGELERELTFRLLRIEERIDQRGEPVHLVKRRIRHHPQLRARCAALELAVEVLELQADVRDRCAQFV